MNLHFSEAVICYKTSKAENASVAQLVEHHVANVIVAGSIPVTRSIFLPFSEFPPQLLSGKVDISPPVMIPFMLGGET